MPTLDIDDQELDAIRSEIGYRLRVELDRDRRPVPPHLVWLVRSLDDTHHQTTSPSTVPDHHRNDGKE